MSNIEVPAYTIMGLKHGKNHMNDSYKQLHEALIEQNELNQIGSGKIIIPQPQTGNETPHDPLSINNLTGKFIGSHLQTQANRQYDNEIGKVQNGGKVIGRGGFGCVFRPPLKCIGKEVLDEGWVSKVLKIKYANEEYDEYKIINDIDPEFKFHLNIKKPCSIDLSHVPTLNEIRDSSRDKCKSIFNIPVLDIGRKYKVIQIEDGGMSLYDFMRTEFDTRSKEQFVECLKGYLNVFRGLKKMSENGYLHADIKQDNILINSDLKMKLTDFGLMTKLEDYIVQMRSRLYFIYPPDIIFISQFYENDRLVLDLDDDIEYLFEDDSLSDNDKYREYISLINPVIKRIENNLDTKTIESLYREIFGNDELFLETLDYYTEKSFFNTYILGLNEDGSKNKDALRNTISKILYTIDLYAFGLVLGLYYVDVYNQVVPDIQEPNTEDARELFGFIITKMTDNIGNRTQYSEIEGYLERLVELADRDGIQPYVNVDFI
jgi:hypothetical protein